MVNTSLFDSVHLCLMAGTSSFRGAHLYLTERTFYLVAHAYLTACTSLLGGTYIFI